MFRIRYTEWDGSQRVRLDADRVFEKLSEVLSYTDDVGQALDWLMRHGGEFDGVEVKGLDELLEELRREMERRYGDVNLDQALDDRQRRFEEMLDLERDALSREGADADGSRRKRLDDLPRNLAEALKQLRDYEFEDDDARQEFENLLEELDNIADLDEFQRAHGAQFQGRRALNFDEALELMREFERFEELEDQLSSGNWQGVDLQAITELLGNEAMQNFRDLQQMQMLIQESGYLTTRQGEPALSPKGVRKIGNLALREIYQALLRDRPGAHRTDLRGITDVRPDATRPFRFGDPLHLDIVGTLKKAVARGGLPLQIRPDDFEVFDTDLSANAATVLLLDMSWSMSWEGRFAAAKKVAMALESLVRTRFPRDYFGVVGFYTRARELKLKDLPDASWNMGDPFTNLQDGLRLASRLLDRQRSRNKQVIVITDGQPTAYFSGGRLYCEWPLSMGGVSMRAAAETLREVERITRKGVVINTFMLDDSPTLRAFVEKMTKINKGRALYTRPDHLGQYLLVDYLGKKKKRL